METQFEGLEDIGDPFLGQVVKEQLQTPIHPVVEFVSGVRERFIQEFQKHPARDTLAAALTLGGLGFAVSATTAHRHP